MAVRKGTFGSAIAASKRDKLSSAKRLMKLEDIKERPHGDTRQLNDEHISELVESIAAVGLIHPIAIDSKGHLLAGGHRKAALKMLEETNPERYLELFPRGVPAHVFEFDVTQDIERAIAIEAAENEKRRDYTRAEVQELATRLLQAGYVDRPGRVSKGTKRLKPALALVIGKSQKTVQRYLNQEEAPPRTDPTWTDVQVGIWDREIKQVERIAAKAGEGTAIARAATRLKKLLKEAEG